MVFDGLLAIVLIKNKAFSVINTKFCIVKIVIKHDLFDTLVLVHHEYLHRNSRGEIESAKPC